MNTGQSEQSASRPGSAPDAPAAEAVIVRLRRQLARERLARREAEDLAEDGLRRLYEEREAAKMLKSVAGIANRAARLQDAFSDSLAVVGHFSGFCIGHAWMVVSPASPLESSGIWWESARGEASRLRDASAAVTFHAGVGLPGRVWVTREIAWLSADEMTVDNFPRAGVFPDLNIKCAVALPVFAAHEVVAVVEFFGRESRPPDEALMAHLREIGTHLGRIVERVRAESSVERRVTARTADLVTARDVVREESRKSHETVYRVLSDFRLEDRADAAAGEVLADLLGAAEAEARAFPAEDAAARLVPELLADAPWQWTADHGLPPVLLDPELLYSAVARLARDDAADGPVEDAGSGADPLVVPVPRSAQITVAARRHLREVDFVIERDTPWRPDERPIEALRMARLAAVARWGGGSVRQTEPGTLVLRVPGRFLERRDDVATEAPRIRRRRILLHVENGVMRLMARAILEGLGCLVEPVSAVDDDHLVPPGPEIDLVLADLPLARRFVPITSDPTVVVGLTHHVSADGSVAAHDAGLAGLLRLPLVRDDAADLIERLFP